MNHDLVKSPMNYIGGKFRILPQILDRFPKNIDTLYDVFGGGGSISINVDAKHIYYNDIVCYVSSLFKSLKDESVESAVEKINEVVSKYSLSKTNVDGFECLRRDYNSGNKIWENFYVLVCYSFNNQYRFNSRHEYNSSFGWYKSCYSAVTEKKLIKFINRIHNLDISFTSEDFRSIDFSKCSKSDLVYFDPPYLITTGNYNDGKRGFKGWTEQDDKDLFNLCDMLDGNKIKFALSNVFDCKGKSNDGLKVWSDKYNLAYINSTYGNCSYHAKDKSKDGTVEVLITNYEY